MYEQIPSVATVMCLSPLIRTGCFVWSLSLTVSIMTFWICTRVLAVAGANKSHGVSNAAKLDNETEDFHHQKVTLEFKLALQKARMAKKWTQADLAKQVQVKQSVINDYEAGKAIPDPQLIQKLNRFLGVTLPKIPKPAKAAPEPQE